MDPFLRPLHLLLSGSRATLLPPRPLRTGHARYRASGSSLRRPVPDPRVVRMMTPPVYQLQVVQLVCSAVAAQHSVVFVDEGNILIGVEPHTTHRALAILPSQQGQPLRRTQCPREAPLPSQLPVVSIVRIQWAAFPLNFVVSSDGSLVVLCESFLAIYEVPSAVEVFGPDPCCCFGGVASFRPAPQRGMDMVVRRMERVF
jgi:hypothetical protein